MSDYPESTCLSGPWQGWGSGSTSGAYTGTFIASLATADSIAQQVGYASPGYDYAVDPSASGVSATETIGANTVMGFGGVVSTTQSGNTIQVTLYGGVSWSTANGTALAGTDYQSNAGSTPAGDTQTTVDITLDNLSALSDTTFFIVTSGGGLSGTFYDPIIIQTIAPQLLADSNNDGRIDATADAAANAAAIKNNTGGVLVDPDPGNDPTAPTNDQSSSQYDPANSGLALVTSGRLVEIDLDLSSLQGLGTSVTLTAQGDTSDFAVWTDPSRTTQITVTGSGTTWPTAQAPAQVWVEAPEGGSQGTSAPAIILMLALQNQSSGQPQSSSVRVQAAAVLDAQIIKDTPSAAGFNQDTFQWLSGAPASQQAQGASVPVDNEDLNNNGIPDDQQTLPNGTPAPPVATDNLLPIGIHNLNGSPLDQNGYYTIGGGPKGASPIPASIRIWLLAPATGTFTLVNTKANVAPFQINVNPKSPGAIMLYVEGISSGVANICLVWHPNNGPAVPSIPYKITVFSIVGPRDVPDQTTYQYTVKGPGGTFASKGVFSAGGFNPGSGAPAGTGTQNGVIETVTWAAAPSGAWGKVDFTPQGSAYTWAAHVAVVGITFGSVSFANPGPPPTPAATPAQIPGTNFINSTNDWTTNPGLDYQTLKGNFGGALPTAMTATVTVNSIIGPTRPGVATQFGVTHIQLGFVQTVTVVSQNVHYTNGTFTSGSGATQERQTYIDGVTTGDPAPTATLASMTTNPTFGPLMFTPSSPWYGGFFNPSAPLNGPRTFSISDTPSFVNMRIAPGLQPDALNLDWQFQTMFVAHTIDTDKSPAGLPSMRATYYLPSNVSSTYFVRASGTWDFNGSGGLASNTTGSAGIWTAIPGTTGVKLVAALALTSPAPGGAAPIVSKQLIAATKSTNQYFNTLLGA